MRGPEPISVRNERAAAAPRQSIESGPILGRQRRVPAPAGAPTGPSASETGGGGSGAAGGSGGPGVEANTPDVVVRTWLADLPPLYDPTGGSLPGIKLTIDNPISDLPIQVLVKPGDPPPGFEPPPSTEQAGAQAPAPMP